MLGAFGTVPQSRQHSSLTFQAAGLLTVTFFGLSAVSRMRMLVKRSALLCISENGLHWAEWSDAVIPWSEISEVSTWSSKGQRAIVVHLRNADRYPGRGLRAWMNKINRSFTGGDLVISMNNTDCTFDQAQQAIVRFRSNSVSPVTTLNAPLRPGRERLDC